MFSYRCNKCKKFKAYNTYDICTICWAEEHEPHALAKIKNSAKYKALQELQDTFSSDESLLESKALVDEALHNDFSTLSREQKIIKAITYELRNREFYLQNKTFIDKIMENQRKHGNNN